MVCILEWAEREMDPDTDQDNPARALKTMLCPARVLRADTKLETIETIVIMYFRTKHRRKLARIIIYVYNILPNFV